MAFDPYESWLGINTADRPPTYYQLLGLSPLESDPEIIEQSALRRIGKVRQHQIGPHSDASQEILSELSRARLVLTDSDRRAEYDAKLRARGEGRPDLSAVVRKNLVVGAANGVAAPANDGLDILAKLRTGDDSGPNLSVTADKKLTDVAMPSEVEHVEGGLNALASIAAAANDGPLSVRNSKKKKWPVLWKNRLFVAAFLSTHVAIIAVFFVFGSAIALHVRSFFSGTDPAAQAVAQNPTSPEGRPARTSPGSHPIDHNRPAPTTWLRFKRGTRVTVAKSADFDMSQHDFTIFAWIKTGNGGTVFSKAPVAGGLAPGAKRLFIRNGSLVFEFHGAPPIATVGVQVDDELWHEVAVTYTRLDRQLFLFIDGKVHGPQTITATRDVTDHVIRIGSVATDLAANDNDHFAGLISEVRFYHRALTKEEIAGLISRDPGGKLPLARWRLRAADGRFFRDQSLHGHVGTLEEVAASNASMLAASDEEVPNAGSPSLSNNARPANGNPPPNGEERAGRQFVGNLGQDEVKADDSPAGILKKHGLKARGALYVPETEDDVQTKATETLSLAGKVKYHLMKEQVAMNAALRPQKINELQLIVDAYNSEIQVTDQTMRSIRRFRGQFYSTDEQALFNQLDAYKSRLQWELRQYEGNLKDLKSQPANLQWNERSAELARADQKAYERALRELRELVDATTQKRDGLKKNGEIRKALDACGKLAKKRINLGTSLEFEKNVRELEKLENDARRGGKRGR